MRNNIINYPMQKRGQVVETIVASTVILLTIISIISIINEGSKIYFGDSSTMKYYDYSQCKKKADNTPQKNLIIFNSEAEAKKIGYEKGDSC